MKRTATATLLTACLIPAAFLAGCHSAYRDSYCYEATCPAPAPGGYYVPPSPPPARHYEPPAAAATHDAMYFRNYGVTAPTDAREENRSTFALDVDTGSYTLARSTLQRGALPDADGVRVEEFVNFFDYGYAPPRQEALALHLAAAPSPFAAGRVLLRVGVKGREVSDWKRPPAVLTFVIDVSGSMAREDRLELVKKSLRLLVDELQEGDRIGIVVYGTSGRALLDPCGVEARSAILRTIDSLAPEGSTNAQEGLQIGYAMARRAYREGTLNRLILCSDGVANTGATSHEAILASVSENARRKIGLTTIGVGMGNYNDELMEQLADKGNGQYFYVDSLREARRVFSRRLTGTLQTIAMDAKVQVEFDPQVVRRHRLVGYENRAMDNRDFRRDRVDGGEIGAGHATTAIYELELAPRQGPLAAVHVRYRDAATKQVVELQRQIATGDILRRFDDADASFRLAATAAQFAEVLRHSPPATGTLGEVRRLARQCRLQMPLRQDVGELAELIDRAGRLGADRGRAAWRDDDDDDYVARRRVNSDGRVWPTPPAEDDE